MAGPPAEWLVWPLRAAFDPGPPDPPGSHWRWSRQAKAKIEERQAR